MPSTTEVAKGVAEWIRGLAPEIVADYHYVPTNKGDLPDLVVEAGTIESGALAGGQNDPRFPTSAMQQVELDIWTCRCSVMVDNDDPEAAADLLTDIADRMRASLRADTTLGDRVQIASRTVTFDLESPLVQYADGTRGREMEATIYVAFLTDHEGF